MRKLILAVSATAMAVPATFALPIDQAQAQRHRHHRGYYRNGYYYGPTWRDRHGRWHCRRPDGTTGLLLGAAGGALIGRSLDHGRDRTTGTVLGAAAGALIGREIERGNHRCR